MWLQIAGKVSLALAPPLNHWWHVGLSVTTRGLTTGPIPCGTRRFQVDFDFVDHRLTVTDGEPGAFTMALEARSVASFYAEFMSGIRERGIDVSIWPRPVEVAGAIPFDEDEKHSRFLHLAHSLDRVSSHELRVRPGKRLAQRGREDDLRHARQATGARLALGGESRHEAVRGRTHQDRVVAFAR